MLFNSYTFIFGFLPLVLACVFILARRVGAGAAQFGLIAASLFFYASWNITYLPLLLGSILFNYLIAFRMTGQADTARRQRLLIFAVAVNLALLGYYKYTNFFVDSINTTAGTHWILARIYLPLGISFYTFQQITLLVDVSAGHIEEFRARDFLLFVIFYPHLVAGPIVHHREMMPQFEAASYKPEWSNLAVGVALFSAGLFKKVILADSLAGHVAPLYAQAASGGPMSMVYAWGAAVGFTLQLYFDFSGYSEMALGLGRMVGIKLPMNFNSPLKARGIIEYWSRWHITLTRFITAYIYTPLSMAATRRRMRRGERGLVGARTKSGVFAAIVGVPTLITMFLAGLWHGAGFQFLVFGALHGVYLTINQIWRIYRPKRAADGRALLRLVEPAGMVLTFLGVFVANAYFRSDGVTSGTNIVLGMFGLHGIELPEVISNRLPAFAAALGHVGITFAPGSLTELLWLYGWIGTLLLIAWCMPNVLEIMRDYAPAITGPVIPRSRPLPLLWLTERLVWRPSLGWALATAAATSAGVLAVNHVTEFLYWQF